MRHSPVWAADAISGPPSPNYAKRIAAPGLRLGSMLSAARSLRALHAMKQKAATR